MPLLLIDARVRHTVDNYENRIVRAFYDQVVSRLKGVLPALEAARRFDLGSEASELRGHLTGARRRAAWLDEVGPLAAPPTRMTMVLLRRPAYRAMMEAYTRFQRRLTVRLDESLEAPLQNLPRLYQVWGTLMIVERLLSAASNAGYRLQTQRLAGRDSSGLFVKLVEDGSTAVELARPLDGATVSLRVAPSFRRTGRRIRSISYRQSPDVVVSVFRPGELQRIYLFDPKYKLDSESWSQRVVADTDEHEADSDEALLFNGRRPKKIDIDKMHA